MMKRSQIAAAGRAAIIVITIVVVGSAAYLLWIIRSPLPKVHGAMRVAGIANAVIIRRDERGIPHISASSETDLFFGDGLACAQDRLWQMDLLRRTAEGKLAEVFGPVALDDDEYFRTLGFAEIARREAARVGGKVRADLAAYAAGVNTAAKSHSLPLEFWLFRYGFEPWTPADSLAIALLETQRLDDQWGAKQVRTELAARYGRRAAMALANDDLPNLDEYIPGYGGTKAISSAGTSPTATSAGASPAATLTRVDHSIGIGSNNWVVAGRRTTTGKPVLSNDTHLPHSVPSIWWIAQLKGAAFDVEGFTLPGLPGVVFGHNAHIAFGATSAAEDVQDLYREQFRSTKSDEYLAGGRWLRAKHRIERIKVRGRPDDALDVLSTRHGPVVERRGRIGYALAWTILREGTNVASLRQLDLATNWLQFRRALSLLAGPVLSFAYADAEGNIGYQDAGRVPMRVNGDGAFVIDGKTGPGWRGDVPFQHLPHVLNPNQGFLATANAALAGPNYQPILSRLYGPPYRVRRIYARLRSGGVMTPGAIGAVQADVYDSPAISLARATAKALAKSSDPTERLIARQLLAWKGMMSLDSPEATFINVERKNLENLLFRRFFGGRYNAYTTYFHPLVAVERALDGDPALASVGITRAGALGAIARAARMTIAELNLGPVRGIDDAEPWGIYNAAIYHHPFGIVWPLTLLNFRPTPQPGDPFTIYATKPDVGPAMRFVADLSDWDNSSMVLTLGESGVWTDAHYGDQLQDWLNVRWVATPFSDAAVATATKNTLRLEPAAPNP